MGGTPRKGDQQHVDEEEIPRAWCQQFEIPFRLDVLTTLAHGSTVVNNHAHLRFCGCRESYTSNAL